MDRQQLLSAHLTPIALCANSQHDTHNPAAVLVSNTMPDILENLNINNRINEHRMNEGGDNTVELGMKGNQ